MATEIDQYLNNFDLFLFYSIIYGQKRAIYHCFGKNLAR
jgi:hypothetical protein